VLGTQFVDHSAAQLLFGVALDAAQHRHIVGLDQADGDAALASTTGTANPVHIDIGGTRQVDVDDMADIRQVDTPGGDVGGYQHVNFFIAEAANGLDPLLLLHLAADPGTVDATGLQLCRQLGQTLPGLDEQYAAFDLFTAQQMAEQGEFMLRRVRQIHQLLDLAPFTARRFSSQFCRFGEHFVGKFDQPGAFQRGGEQHGLFTPARFTDDTINFTDEAHIQHAVGFIDDQDFDGAAIEAFGFDVFHQASGGGDYDVGGLGQRRQLLVVTDAADDGGNDQMGMCRQSFGMLGDLQC